MQKLGEHAYMYKKERYKTGSKSNYFWFLLFSFGLAIGAVAASIFMEPNTAVNSQLMAYLKNIQNISLSDRDSFIRICVLRMIEVLALAGVIYMFRTPFFFCLLTIVFGTVFGYLMAILTMNYGAKSCIVMIFLMLPQYLFYIPVYIIFIKISEKKVFYEGDFFEPNGGHKIVGIVASTVFIMVLAGVLMESYVNPLFVKKIVKIF